MKYVGIIEIKVENKILSFKWVLLGAEFAFPISKLSEILIPNGRDIKKTIIHIIKYTKKIDKELIWFH